MSLINRYRLSDEIKKDWRQPASIPHVSIYALDFAILHKIQYLIDFIIDYYQHMPEINRATTQRKLTPLHLAAITANQEAAEKLLQAGANPNSCDRRNWTPLHHAALASNAEMIRLLIQRGADPAIKTKLGATFSDIANLLQPSEKEPACLWRDDEGQQNAMTADAFRAITQASYLTENHINPEQLYNEWQQPQFKKFQFPFTESVRQHFLSMPKMPVHVLAKVATNPSPGLGLFAKEAFQPKAILGEYLGVIEDNQPINNYVLGKINAEKSRNEIPHINDGFINSVMVPISNTKGLPQRDLMIAAESIAVGEQFCWNYGFHPVKLGPYVELRPKEMREFIKTSSITDLVQCLLTVGIDRQIDFENFVKAEKFRYLLCTPSVLFAMALDQTLSSQKVKQISALSFQLQCIPQNANPVLRQLPKIAKNTLQVIDHLKKCFPESATHYLQFLKKLPAQKGILDMLYAAEQINEYLSQKLEQLKNHIDITRYFEGGDPILINILNSYFFEVALK